MKTDTKEEIKMKWYDETLWLGILIGTFFTGMVIITSVGLGIIPK